MKSLLVIVFILECVGAQRFPQPRPRPNPPFRNPPVQPQPVQIPPPPPNQSDLTSPNSTLTAIRIQCVPNQWCNVDQRCCPSVTGAFRCCPAHLTCSSDGLRCLSLDTVTPTIPTFQVFNQPRIN